MSFRPWRTLDYDDFLTSLHLINCCILFVQFSVVVAESLRQESCSRSRKSPESNAQDKNKASGGYETIVQQLLQDKQEQP